MIAVRRPLRSSFTRGGRELPSYSRDRFGARLRTRVESQAVSEQRV
jgi:galactokinase/mevalonate kinase-like predicted kinase